MAELDAAGYEVHVVTSPGPEVPDLRARADEVHLIRMERGISAWQDMKSMRAWVSLLRRIRPTLIIGGTPKAALFSMVAAAIVRVPRRVYFLQGLRLEGTSGLNRQVLATMERLTSACSHIVIAVSPSLALAYKRARLPMRRRVAIPHHGSSHGVDTEYFRPMPRSVSLIRSLGMDPEVPIVAFLGRLTADKGLAELLQASDIVREAGGKVQVLALGAQDEADSALIAWSVAQSKVRIVIREDVPDVRPYLACSDVVALPTRREGFPNVVLEAAAMGVPSVTTRATGAVDAVIPGQTGLLVDVNDPAQLADALLTFIENPELRRTMGAAARERVLRDFQPRDVARAVVRIALSG